MQIAPKSRSEIQEYLELGQALGAIAGYGVSKVPGGGAATTGPGQAAGPDLKVVGIIGLQGVMAADGKEIHNGTVMAIDELNENWGGVLGRKIQYVEIDDGQSSAASLRAISSFCCGERMTPTVCSPSRSVVS